MRWEELSMSDRSNLMKTYLQNGVTQLSDMRDHYNKFADGGEVDNVHSTQAQDFIASWLSNRQEQFRENFRNSGSTMIPYSILPKSWSDRAAFKEYQNQLKNLRTVKQYDVLGNTKFPHVPDSEFESIKKLSNHTGGAYNPSTHAISYISPYAGTDVHELTHSLNADPQINAIKYGFEGDKLQEGKQYNSYKDSANEIYSRLMQFRYLNKLDPTKKYSVEDIKKWREKYDDTDIVNRYTDEYLLHLLNNVASTKSSLEKDGRKLAAFGGPLRDEYDNPDQYYDYRTAEEVGDMYDPKSKHWASRDPRTGMILKNSKHPTFGMAIREDQSSGHAPFIDSSTGRYYTLRPEEYATSPYKPTLRRVNKFKEGGNTEGQKSFGILLSDINPIGANDGDSLSSILELNIPNTPRVVKEIVRKELDSLREEPSNKTLSAKQRRNKERYKRAAEDVGFQQSQVLPLIRSIHDETSFRGDRIKQFNGTGEGLFQFDKDVKSRFIRKYNNDWSPRNQMEQMKMMLDTTSKSNDLHRFREMWNSEKGLKTYGIVDEYKTRDNLNIPSDSSFYNAMLPYLGDSTAFYTIGQDKASELRRKYIDKISNIGGSTNRYIGLPLNLFVNEFRDNPDYYSSEENSYMFGSGFEKAGRPHPNIRYFRTY